MTSQNADFALRLRQAREARNLSQEGLAELLGTSSKNVSRWERGKSLPVPHFRAKIVALLQELGQPAPPAPPEQAYTFVFVSNDPNFLALLSPLLLEVTPRLLEQHDEQNEHHPKPHP